MVTDMAMTIDVRPTKILFVDDDIEILKSLKRLTRNLNETLYFCDDPVEAIDIVNGNNIDIVISDLRMPVMNGITLLSKIAEQCPETIRIMLTGNSDTNMMMSAINNGRIWAFIEKPWQGQQLLATLKQAVQTKKLIYNRNNQLHRELEQAKLTADAGINAKREFLAVMSHEIRTPMNAILGSLELLSDTKLEGQQIPLLRNAQSSGKALLSIVNNILDYSKIEAGKLLLHNNKFLLLSTIDYLQDIFEETATSKNIALLFCVAPSTSAQLFLDEQRLNQVLINLIGNALKFTQDGGVEVFIHNSEDHIFFEVTDTGIGINKNHLTTLFDEFVQVDSSYTRQHEGTGLGLSIAKKLVELMGGELSVSSLLGKGSTFTVRLPHLYKNKPLICPDKLLERTVNLVNYSEFCQATITKQLHLWRCKVNIINHPSYICQLSIAGANSPLIKANNPSQQKPSKSGQSLRYSSLLAKVFDTNSQPLIASKSLPTPQQGNGEPILLVEDSLPNQLVAATLLENANYSVDIASDGVEAIHLAKQKTYRLILMDLSMPKMDGAQACQKIRAAGGALATLPIWAMTANVSRQDIKHCMNAGMNDFIEKPINKKVLLLKIGSLFQDLANLSQQNLAEMMSTTVIEMAIVEQLAKDTGANVCCRIIDLFINETAQRIKRISEALGQGDRVTMQNEAHAIKSSAATLGANTLSHLAQSLERNSNKDKLFELEPIVSSLQHTASQAFGELSVHREKYCD